MTEHITMTPARRAYLVEFDRFVKAGGAPTDMHGATPRLRQIREAMFNRLQDMRSEATTTEARHEDHP